MSSKVFSAEKENSLKIATTNVVLVTNAFVWYFYAFDMLTQSVEHVSLTYMESLSVWSIHFGAAIISAFLGALISIRLKRRLHFLYGWMLLGFFSSFANFSLYNAILTNILLVSFLIGVSFGLGMPTCIAYYGDATITEKRARLGGLIFLLNGLGYFLIGMISVEDIIIRTFILALWRGLGFLILLLLKPSEEAVDKNKNASFLTVIRVRSFILYFVPWWMLCLVNYLNVPTLVKFFGENFYRSSTLMEGLLAGAFSVIGGYLSDVVGRKRVIIVGFTMLGLGYATLGIYPESLFSWWFYTVVDGAAWGVFYVLFILTLWGDIAYYAPREKYYALGGLPFFLSNFLKIIVAPYIAETFSVYTVFSLASFFLFLAVLPLMYAPETLPEKKLRERELKKYIEKAKKIKEKYV
jgi:MFS family permease